MSNNFIRLRRIYKKNYLSYGRFVFSPPIYSSGFISFVIPAHAGIQNVYLAVAGIYPP
jgi:hypothetical protein